MQKCVVCKRVGCICDMLSEEAILGNQGADSLPATTSPPGETQDGAQPTDSNSSPRRSGTGSVSDLWRQGVSN